MTMQNSNENWVIQRLKEKLVLRSGGQGNRSLADRMLEFGGVNKILSRRQVMLHVIYIEQGERLLRLRGVRMDRRLAFAERIEVYSMVVGDVKNARMAYSEIARGEREDEKSNQLPGSAGRV